MKIKEVATATSQFPIEQTHEFRNLLDKIAAIKDTHLADAIPAELFKPNIWRGLLGVFVSYMLYIGSIVALAYAPHWSLYVPLWLIGGLGGFGLYCIGHDCGHNSFSRSHLFNYVIGQMVLLPLLFPFHGWRHMNNFHHSNTNRLDLDPDWRPISRDQFKRMSLWDRLMYAGARSWFWWFSTVNYQWHCVLPSSFTRHEARNDVRHSIVVVLVFAISYLSMLVYFTSWQGLLLYFVGPWIAIHAWFSTTTLMHHTTEELPFLTKAHWTPNAGRLLLTTDYNYPKWLHFLTHNLSLHTAHHVAPTVPFYNLLKAREAIKRAHPGMVREKKIAFRELFKIICRCHFYDPLHGYYVAFGKPESSFPGAASRARLEPNP